MREGDIIGHEPMGIVEEVGADVEHVAPGDRVVVPFNVSCGHCFFCDQDLYSQCETTRDRGKLAESVNLLGRGGVEPVWLHARLRRGAGWAGRVPQGTAGPLRADQSQKVHRTSASSTSPMCCPPPGRPSLMPTYPMVGPWQSGVSVPIGQMCARMAMHQGAGRVIGVDNVPERLALASRWGVQTIDYSAVDSVRDVILNLTDGRGVDSAIDAVGMEAGRSAGGSILQTTKLQLDRATALRESMSAVRRGGTLSLSGGRTCPHRGFPC